VGQDRGFGHAREAADITPAEPLLERLAPAALLADKGDDINALAESLESRGIVPVIPPKAKPSL
jgi:hypothetical protein